MRGAAALLSPAGVLVTYGPYLEDGVATSPGNLAFDADLRARRLAFHIGSEPPLLRRYVADSLAPAPDRPI